VTDYRKQLRAAIELLDSDIPAPSEALVTNYGDNDEDPSDISSSFAELDGR
jgi:hypothetical protein